MDSAPFYHITAHWPRRGFIWPYARNPTQGEYFIRPLYTNPRWRDAILVALESAPGFPCTNPTEMEPFVDYCLDMLVTTATNNFIRLLYVDVLTFFTEIKDQVPWAEGLSAEVILFLSVEMTRARAQWHSQPSAQDQFEEHTMCARSLDLFRKVVVGRLEKLRYRVFRSRDDAGRPVIIEEGMIAHFAAQGLVFNLTAGEGIVSAQLVDGIQHLTIGTEQSNGAQTTGRQSRKRAAEDSDGDFLIDVEEDIQPSTGTRPEKRLRLF